MSSRKLRSAWVIPVFASLAAPWLEKLINVRLISEYYQPRLSIFATILGPVALMVAYGLLKNRPVATKSRWAIVGAIGLFVCFLICIGFENWLGTLWVPDENAMAAMRILWIAVYELMFVFLALALGAGSLLVRR